jgi:glycosyltransferase involved in cell wall biosynthesis
VQGGALQKAVMSPPPAVTLVISSLGAGGAERALSALANALAEKGWPITLLTLASAETPPYYPLHPAIRLRPLDLLRPSRSRLEGLRANLRRLRVLRRAIRDSRPGAVVSFMDQTNVLTLAATRGLGLPVIVSERIYPGLQPLPRIWAALRRRLYPRAFAVVAQTRRGLDWFPPDIRARGRVIPNHVEPHRPGPRSYDGPAVVGTGRLVAQKGFPILLRAFARVAAAHPDWSLVLWGEGPDRPSLTTLAAELGLGGRCRLPGLSERPGGWIDGAGIFALSSLAEGFPNVLLEAMAAGLPVVAADCPTGPAELLRPEENGLLVPTGDVAALAAALDRLMGDAALRDRLGAAARRVGEEYGRETIIAGWSGLLEEACRG